VTLPAAVPEPALEVVRHMLAEIQNWHWVADYAPGPHGVGAQTVDGRIVYFEKRDNASPCAPTAPPGGFIADWITYSPRWLTALLAERTELLARLAELEATEPEDT
jgi:hypothetical protein